MGQKPSSIIANSDDVQSRSCAWLSQRCIYHVEDQDIRNLKIRVVLRQKSGPHEHQKGGQSSSSQEPAPSPSPAPAQPIDPNNPTQTQDPNKPNDPQPADPNNPQQAPPPTNPPPQTTYPTIIQNTQLDNVFADFSWQQRIIGRHEVELISQSQRDGWFGGDPNSTNPRLPIVADVQREVRHANPPIQGSLLYTYNDKDQFLDSKSGVRFTNGGGQIEAPAMMADLHAADGPFFQMAPFRAMWLMASLTENVNGEVHRYRVTLGAIRAYDGGHMLEVCPPFLHGQANPQDQYSFVLPGGSEYEYSIQNVSEQPDPKMLDKLDQQHVALDAKAGRLRQNLVGHGFEGPDEFSEAQFHMVGSIDSFGDPHDITCGISPQVPDDDWLEEVYTPYPCCRSLNALYIIKKIRKKYEAGPNITILFAKHAKVTYQLVLPIDGNWEAKPIRSSTAFAALSPIDDVYRFMHPLEIHLTCNDVSNGLVAPRLVVCVIEQDSLGRQNLDGYGIMDLPLWPGKHSLECPLWKPRGTVRQQLAERYCGTYLPLLDMAMASHSVEHKNPRNRFTINATSCSRRVAITLQVAQTEMPGGTGTALMDAAKARGRAQEMSKALKQQGNVSAMPQQNAGVDVRQRVQAV